MKITSPPKLQQKLAGITDDTLIRLVYTSRISKTGRDNPNLFQHIEQHATTYNKSNGVTGVLCNDKTYFLQYLEGKKSEILPLMSRIFIDTHHYDVTVILAEPIERQQFSDWWMRSLYLEQSDWPEDHKDSPYMELSPFLPLQPYKWSEEHTTQFICALKMFKNFQKGTTEVHYNTLGVSQAKLITRIEKYYLPILLVMCLVIAALLIFM